VRQRIAQRLESGNLPHFTVSFGVASSDQAVDFEGAVTLADEALLRAKEAGRDRIVVAGDDRPGPLRPYNPVDVGRAEPAVPLTMVTPP
jgi:hypothetical protein